MSAKNCKGCDKPLSTRNTSGSCRKCFCALSKHERKGGHTDSDYMRWISGQRLSWCPVDLLPDYRRLTRIQGYSAVRARWIIKRHMNIQLDRHYAGFEAVG